MKTTNNFRPIAMRCNEEQFNAIKLKLEKIKGVKIKNPYPFASICYLVNNGGGNLLHITNVIHSIDSYDREVFEEWDEDKFLEYCGVEKKKLVKCIEVGDNIHITYGKIYEVIEEDADDRYAIINDYGGKGIYFKRRFEIVNQEENKNMSQKLRVSVTDVLRIHAVACLQWQKTFASYLSRTDSEQKIQFTQSEVNKMFEAATDSQKPVLEEIFGKQSKPIDLGKIKTGSIVMIKHTGQHVEGIGGINSSNPVTVVFFKTTHLIKSDNTFRSNGAHHYYCTFYQDGKYVVFAADEINYITEVIEY